MTVSWRVQAWAGCPVGKDELHNPEALLVISLSGCHLLTYLAECARAGLHVLSYENEASGVKTWHRETFRSSEVVLRPRVLIEEGDDPELAEELHHKRTTSASSHAR